MINFVYELHRLKRFKMAINLKTVERRNFGLIRAGPHPDYKKSEFSKMYL